MYFYGDYHTHSYYSDGRQRIVDIVIAAQKAGLQEVAITDHGPLAAVIGVMDPERYLYVKEAAARIQEDYPEVRILVGAEANIRDTEGTLNIPQEIADQLDLLIAGLHPYTLPTSVHDGAAIWLQNRLRHLGPRQARRARQANTEACIAAVCNNPSLDILSHPGLFFSVDMAQVADACTQNGVLFEINCGHSHPSISDIMEAEQTGVHFIINSDAHFQQTVGNQAYGRSIIDQLDIARHRVANHADGGGIAVWGKKGKTCTS